MSMMDAPVTEIDNPVCFICELRPTRGAGSFLFCSRHQGGEVRWSKYKFRVPEPKKKFVYMGKTTDYVDFSKPGAPSSPA